MTMDEQELKAIIENKLDRSLNEQDGGVSDVREDNFDRYLGMPYGNEKEGFSDYVSRECFEVVEWAMPSVMKVLLASGKRLVSFDPVGPEDEDRARQETEAVNYWLLQRNKGFLALHTLIKDCLMNPVAYAKVWVDRRERVETEKYKGIPQGILDKLEADDTVEVEDAEGKIEFIVGEPIEVFDVTVKRTIEGNDVSFSSVEPEQLLIDRDLTSLDMNEADFICHRDRRTISDLVELGLDRDDLESISRDSENEFNDERTTRLFYEEEHPHGGDEDDDKSATRTLWVHDIFMKVDWDDDGIAERRHILMAGNEVFINEPITYQPFVAVSAIPIPHKHTGLSYIEAVKDLQLISTSLQRQLLDNVTKQTINKKYMFDQMLSVDGQTLDQAMDPDSEFVITSIPPAQGLMPEPSPPIIPGILQALESMQEKPQMRSGVSPQLSLDADALKQSTEGAYSQAMDWANQRLELLARVIAELGIKEIALKAHHILRHEVDVEMTVKLSGSWVSMNPSEWIERTDMTVRAGLGYDSNAQQIAGLQAILDIQRQNISTGLSTPALVYQTWEKMIAAMNMGHASSFFVDPRDPSFQRPPPEQDPNMVLAQAEMLKAQTAQQTTPKKLEIEAIKAKTDNETKVGSEIASIELRKRELDLKERELVLREMEIEANIRAKEDQTRAEIRLKEAQTEKAIQEAASIEIDNSDTAVELVALAAAE